MRDCNQGSTKEELKYVTGAVVWRWAYRSGTMDVQVAAETLKIISCCTGDFGGTVVTRFCLLDSLSCCSTLLNASFTGPTSF